MTNEEYKLNKITNFLSTAEDLRDDLSLEKDSYKGLERDIMDTAYEHACRLVGQLELFFDN